MRVAELSRRSGVSIASIKFYLREGLLPPGERTGPNQAAYSEEHVRRLRLVRALLDVGGLSVAGARDVLGAVDDPEVELHRVLGTAQRAVTPVPPTTEDEAAHRAGAVVDDLVARRGWHVHPESAGRRATLEILATSFRLGGTAAQDVLEVYAETVEALARHEVAAVLGRTGDREATVEGAVLGMVLGGSLLSALRTMAQEAESARRLGHGAG